MLRNLKSLAGFRIAAKDGDIGEVEDFYFDDSLWSIRFIVVDTGRWLSGRKVLISPEAVFGPNWEREELGVNLTRQQVEASPDIDTKKPVSRQQLADLSIYYGWAPLKLAYQSPPPMDAVEATLEAEKEGKPEPHLRSMSEVLDYKVEAADGEVGHLEDLVVDDSEWVIRYMVVDTGHWLVGHKVIISPDWSEEINWAEAAVKVNLTKEAIKGSPPYDPDKIKYRDYEEQLYKYYGKPNYWSKPKKKHKAA